MIERKNSRNINTDCNIFATSTFYEQFFIDFYYFIFFSLYLADKNLLNSISFKTHIKEERLQKNIKNITSS